MNPMSPNATPPTEPPQYYTREEYHCCYRPMGSMSLAQAVDIVCAALRHAALTSANRLLVDVTGLTGFETPTIVERQQLARRLADAAQGKLRMVMLAKPEWIREDKFAIMVARNHGLNSNVFDNEPEALAWLRR